MGDAWLWSIGMTNVVNISRTVVRERVHVLLWTGGDTITNNWETDSIFWGVVLIEVIKIFHPCNILTGLNLIEIIKNVVTRCHILRHIKFDFNLVGYWAVPQTLLGDLTALFRSRRFLGGLLLRIGQRREWRNKEKRGAWCRGEFATVTRIRLLQRSTHNEAGPQASHQLNPALSRNVNIK